MITLWNNRSNSNPWLQLLDLQRNLDRVFDFNFGDAQAEGFDDERVFHPACEVDENETHFMINVDLPGLTKKDITIEVKDNQLKVTGERKSERKARMSSERFYGKFQRIFTLPTNSEAEKIEAQYQDGVLSIALPKAESAKTRQIKITDGKTSFLGKLVSKSESQEKEARTASASNVA